MDWKNINQTETKQNCPLTASKPMGDCLIFIWWMILRRSEISEDRKYYWGERLQTNRRYWEAILVLFSCILNKSKNKQILSYPTFILMILLNNKFRSAVQTK